MTSRIGLMAAAGLFVATAGRAPAMPITYTETVTASGSLGSTTFTNALVTLTATADTNNIVNYLPGYLGVNNTTATVSVAGDGSGTFTIPTLTYDSQLFSAAGFESGTTGVPGSNILDVGNSAFATYNLRSSIGPLSGTPAINSGTTFSTTAGSFILNSTSGNATFQATAVPEPATLAPAVTGVLLIACYAWRRARRATA
jgi:hypothetical protein